MENQINHGIPSNEQEPDKHADCLVTEEQFPCIGKCCHSLSGSGGAVFGQICPRCAIWKSLPDSVNLEVTTILECNRFGYGKRIKA